MKRTGIEYLRLYKNGLTQKEIANKFGVDESTVSRGIRRAEKYKCPFSSNCFNCPLPECAIKDNWAEFVNCSEDKRCNDKRRRTRRNGS